MSKLAKSNRPASSSKSPVNKGSNVKPAAQPTDVKAAEAAVVANSTTAAAGQAEPVAAAPATPAKKRVSGPARYRGMSKQQRLDITIHAAEKSVAKALEASSAYKLESIAALLTECGKDLADTRIMIANLPADWTPPKAARPASDKSASALAVGSTIAIREKKVAKYAPFMTTEDLTVTRTLGGKVMVKDAAGTNYGPIPRGDVIIIKAAAPVAPLPTADATPAASPAA